MTAGGLPSINENQSKLTNHENNAIASQMDMGMDDDSVMKEESRMSATKGE